MGGPRHSDTSVGRRILETDHSAGLSLTSREVWGFMGGRANSRVGIYSSTLLAHVLAVPQATSLHPDNSKKHIQTQNILFPILIYSMHVFKNHKEQMKCRT